MYIGNEEIECYKKLYSRMLRCFAVNGACEESVKEKHFHTADLE
ncbi:MAG: hypothetical protein RHS_2286 [Robinsoniella sp. RHS]|nr:MAG: hypothetical protein RHS_2286 [Robinsoniella sp. RHS]